MAAPTQFLNEVVAELKKVVFPTRDDIVRLTTVVVLVSLIVGLFLGGIDFILTKVLEVVVK